jgi:putative two-component system response regulator
MNKKTKVLLVEDENITHQAIYKSLLMNEYECIGAKTLADATSAVKNEAFDIIICDVMLPDGSGLQLLDSVRKFLFNIPFVVITASEKKRLIQEALARGASDFLTKPFHLNNLPTIIERNIERKKLENFKNNHKKASVLLKAIKSLITALEAKDSYTSGHSVKVAHHARLMGDVLCLSKNEKFTLELSAILHDIGKIGIPDNILHKTSSLLEMEYKTAKEHTVIGSKIVGKIDELQDVAAIIRHHHERYDGKGYPDGLCGDAIPLSARILAIVDAYESIVSDRVYRKHKSSEAALQEIINNAGTQFDPALVMIFADVIHSDFRESKHKLRIEDESKDNIPANNNI